MLSDADHLRLCEEEEELVQIRRQLEHEAFPTSPVKQQSNVKALQNFWSPVIALIIVLLISVLAVKSTIPSSEPAATSGPASDAAPFADMGYIWLFEGCADKGIVWIEERLNPSVKNKLIPRFAPKTLEEKAIIAAFRKPMGRYAYMQKVIYLRVDGDWAHGGCIDVKEQTDGEQFVAHKEKGRWKIIAEGSAIVWDLEAKHIKVPDRLKKKWWGD